MTYPFGHWVMIDRLPDEPLIVFVYLDPRAGPSAKGGLSSERDLATMPSRTVRLSPALKLTELAPAEVAAHNLPARPIWLDHYGPQPDPDAPWHRDPLLEGKFHAQYPDDVQTFVHDGDPRRTRRGPELCWVRILKIERAPTRRLTASDFEPSRHVYIGELLNQPHTLQSVKRGDRIKLISVHGLPHPLHVTDEYLREREQWTITPCNKCGASECFDPPSVMAKVRFPDAPVDAQPIKFTSFCSHCGGIQELERIGIG
ncbi:MAG TPA: hypothetical protein VLX92_31440 [Kofleriaceae bacterium]|nr:hypothetical protein [Kofleriaceae bacterium]